MKATIREHYMKEYSKAVQLRILNILAGFYSFRRGTLSSGMHHPTSKVFIDTGVRQLVGLCPGAQSSVQRLQNTFCWRGAKLKPGILLLLLLQVFLVLV